MPVDTRERWLLGPTVRLLDRVPECLLSPAERCKGRHASIGAMGQKATCPFLNILARMPASTAPAISGLTARQLLGAHSGSLLQAGDRLA